MHNTKLRWRLLPLIIILALMAIPLVQKVWHDHQVARAAAIAQTRLQTTRARLISGKPDRIVIPRFGIDLPVVPGAYNQRLHEWSVSPTAANYATNTDLLNNQHGQTLIYGHNNRHVFGPTLNLKLGDLVYVYTTNSHLFQYTYEGSQDITPTSTDIFKQMKTADHAGLKLITCNGSQFEFRHFMSFKLVKAT